MRKISMVAITLLAVFFLSSCEKEAKEKLSTNNASFNVELLFEIDGCKVYRFKDMSTNRYFTTCQGSVSWNENHGKNNNVDMEVPTNTVK